MAILDRVRDRRGVFTDLGDVAGDTRRAIERNGTHASDLADETANGVADAAKRVSEAARSATETAADAVKGATGTAADTVKDVSDATRDRIEGLGELVREIAREWANAGGGKRLDERVDVIAQRLRAAMPAATFKGAVSRLERELPDTDKDRYDRAFERGRVRTRSIYIVGGLAAGIVAGLAGAMLLDPQRGAARRERIARLRDDATATVSARSKELAGRARSMAAERGIGQPKPATDPIGTTDREMVPVMPVGDGPVTDPSSIVREPLPAEGGRIEGGVMTVDAASTVDATGDRALTSNHG